LLLEEQTFSHYHIQTNIHRPGGFSRQVELWSLKPALWILLLAAGWGWPCAGAEPPEIPIGLDAYLQWDRWAYQRIGARAYMRSTYDRSGGNEGADASHFLYQLADDFNVTLDVEGNGILYFARYNHWHGSPWHYEVDGVDHLVSESSTANPNQPTPNSVFLPETAFPPKLSWTWSTTKGADLSWVPIGFERSFRMAYSRTRYGTGYYIYHQYVRGTKLSQPIRSWNERMAPSQEVSDLIGRAGTDLSPKSCVQLDGSQLTLRSNETKTLVLLTNGPSTIRKLSFVVPRQQALAFGRARLRVTWDGRTDASIEAPAALFFGAGTLYNREEREYLVKGFPMFIRFHDKRVELACFFPMPFFRSAKIELSAPPAESLSDLQWSVRYEPFADPPGHVGYFHATYRDHLHPEPGKDLVLLDTRSAEGEREWSGSFVGTSWIFSERAFLGTLEGDPRFFFDDSQSPQAYGTGTEEWGGGGDYWGGLNMTLPLAGHPTGARKEPEAKNAEDKVESAYRFLLADLMPFGRNAVIRLEHGGQNESNEHYQTLTYWYGAPKASLIKTDELKIGDPSSESAHRYLSPDASEPYVISSRYEWGVDSIDDRSGGKTIAIPEQSDRGRRMKGTSEFTLKLTPRNLGVLLRRKLDYAFPNQRAEVFVAAAASGPDSKDWKPAGIWYLAGGNTCVYSNPKEELGPTRHVVQTSNRRFRDDEFLVPRDLTEGRSSIRVRVKFTPVERPLFPGHPLDELAWSEIRYDAYCFVMPE
jgi:hypothetical protein